MLSVTGQICPTRMTWAVSKKSENKPFPSWSFTTNHIYGCKRALDEQEDLGALCQLGLVVNLSISPSRFVPACRPHRSLCLTRTCTRRFTCEHPVFLEFPGDHMSTCSIDFPHIPWKTRVKVSSSFWYRITVKIEPLWKTFCQ